MLRQVDVLGVVKVCIRRVEDRMDHPGLQVQEHSTGNVVLIISLGEIIIIIYNGAYIYYIFCLKRISGVNYVNVAQWRIFMLQSHHLVAIKFFASASPRQAVNILSTPHRLVPDLLVVIILVIVSRIWTS